MMLLTRNEVVGLIQFAIQKTATTLGIQDVEWKSTDELLSEIKKMNSEAHKLLSDFIGAYSEWFEFHEKIERPGNEGNLSSDEKRGLSDKIKNRDTTRQKILDKLKMIAGR